MKTMTKKEINDALRSCVTWFGILPLGGATPQADVAKLIGKSVRTVEGYLSQANDRTISADDLMTLAIAATRKIASFPRQPRMPILVYDNHGQVVSTAHGAGYASFLADIEGGYWEYDPEIYSVKMPFAKEDVLKSKLRRLLRSGAFTVEEACKQLECDDYTLVMYQCVWPFHRCQVPPAYEVEDLYETAQRLALAA